MDVYNTVKRVHNNLDQKAVVADAAKIIGYDNEFLLFRVVLDRVAHDARTATSLDQSPGWSRCVDGQPRAYGHFVRPLGRQVLKA